MIKEKQITDKIWGGGAHFTSRGQDKSGWDTLLRGKVSPGTRYRGEGDKINCYTGTFCTSNFKLKQVLVDLLASRCIKDINLSSTTVEFEDFNVTNFCMTVSKLTFSNSWIMYYQRLNKAQMCRSLTKLDLSQFQIFHLFNIPKHINITNYPPVNFEQPP